MTVTAGTTSPGSGRSSLIPGILAVGAAVTALLVAATELDAGVGTSRSLAVALPAIGTRPRGGDSVSTQPSGDDPRRGGRDPRRADPGAVLRPGTGRGVPPVPS